MTLKEISEVFKVDPASIRYHIKQKHCNPSKERVNGRATWIFSEQDVDSLRKYVSKPESPERRKSVEDRLAALEDATLHNSMVSDGLMQGLELHAILLRRLFSNTDIEPSGFIHVLEQAEAEVQEKLPEMRWTINRIVSGWKEELKNN